MKSYTLDDFARMIDHTNLHTDASPKDMEVLCNEAKEHHFAMVAINQVQSALCAKLLEGTDIHTGAAISFPLGQTTIASKVFDTKDAIANGASEIDMVINIGFLKDGRYEEVENEIRAIHEACDERILKVIIETCLLTEEEKIKMCEIVTNAGAEFIKTSTGFSTAGATFADVELMKKYIGKNVKVKAAGGISSFDDAEKFISLGAERLGTSRLIKILKNTDTGAGY